MTPVGALIITLFIIISALVYTLIWLFSFWLFRQCTTQKDGRDAYIIVVIVVIGVTGLGVASSDFWLPGVLWAGFLFAWVIDARLNYTRARAHRPWIGYKIRRD